MKEYKKYLIETLRNNADHFMATDYEWSNALVHLLLDSADAIEQKKERAEMIGLDSEICDLPYTLRSIVVSKPNMGSFSKETILKAADAIEELLAFAKFVAREAIDTGDNDGVSAEILCRKLNKLGLIETDGEFWMLPAPPKGVE